MLMVECIAASLFNCWKSLLWLKFFTSVKFFYFRKCERLFENGNLKFYTSDRLNVKWSMFTTDTNMLPSFENVSIFTTRFIIYKNCTRDSFSSTSIFHFIFALETAKKQERCVQNDRRSTNSHLYNLFTGCVLTTVNLVCFTCLSIF